MASIPAPSVVAGVDGSPSSLAALDYAAEWAVRHRTGLRIVHAHMPPYIAANYGRFLALAPDEDVRRAIHGWLRDLVEKVRDDHPALVEVQAVDAVGDAAAVLIGESEHATVTIVGCRGLGGFTELMLGSVSAHLATHGHGPVVVLRPPAAVAPGPEQRPPHRTPGPVLACYDGSPASQAALRFAADEAAVRDVPLIVTHVYGGDEAAAKQLLTDAAEALAGGHTGGPIELCPMFSRHSPQHALLEASRDAALTVVGGRGHGLLASVLLGSVTHFMIHHGYGPVAVIHPAAHRKEGK